MSTQQTFHWQIFEEDDQEAQELFKPPNPAQNLSPDTNKRTLKPRQWSALVGAIWPALFIGLAVAATVVQGAWHEYVDGFGYIQDDIRHVIEVEAQTLETTSSPSFRAAGDEDRLDDKLSQLPGRPPIETELYGDEGFAPDVTILDGERRGDVVLVEVLVPNSAPALSTAGYRETRFYQWIGGEWQRMEPVLHFWGQPQVLETPYFRFEFRERDAETVAVVAARMDAVYAALQRDLGLPDTQAQDKLTIEVLAEPGFHTQRLTWHFANNEMQIPSPALLQIPAERTNADALSDILTPALTYQLVDRALHAHQVKPQWSLLMTGLRQFFYQEYNSISFWTGHEEPWDAYSDSPQLSPLISLDMLPVSQGNRGMELLLWNYITTTYGKETRLEFVKQLGQHDGWGTLIPAVFGVSAAEFQADWQAYLAAKHLPSDSDAEVRK